MGEPYTFFTRQSSDELVEGLSDRSHPYQLAIAVFQSLIRPISVNSGQDDSGKSHLDGFAYPEGGLRRAPYFSTEPHFAEDSR